MVKEYLRRLGKRIFLFFIFGISAFFILRYTYNLSVLRGPFVRKETIGLVGAYTLNNLPSSVLLDLSDGLTQVSDNGDIKPSIAKSWRILDDGKTYVFNLRKGLRFSDGSELFSDAIDYNFSDVLVRKPDNQTIIFRLKESFSPFLVTVSRPVFKKGFIGVGPYKIKSVKLNGSFVESLTLVLLSNPSVVKVYQFYPSTEALKIAFALGEISEANGVYDTKIKNISFSLFPNAFIGKETNYNQLVALFFNTGDSILSDKKVRNALSYAIPDKFTDGERAYSPFPHISWAKTDYYDRKSDLEHAKLLLEASSSATKSASLTLKIKTLAKYQNSAEEITELWNRIGVKTGIEVVNRVPDDFQIFLGDFYVSKDPDQYSLWHSDQSNNITRYKNMRIDKLLEDGRKTVGGESRKKIYIDFQKYLLDDSPAVFLYFPYEYAIRRK